MGGASSEAGAADRVTLESTFEAPLLEPPLSVLFGSAPEYAFVFARVRSRHTVAAIADFRQECSAPDPDFERNLLLFDFFHDATQDDSTVTGPGTFTAWVPPLNADQPTPTDDRIVVTYAHRSPDGAEGFLAQRGTVTVTDIDADTLRVTFDLVFNDGTLSGTFEAPWCGDWTQGASIGAPTGPSTAPAPKQQP